MDKEDILYRAGGLALLLFAAGLGWWGYWQPLQDAAAGAPVVSINGKMVVLVPICGVLGLFFLLCGNRVPYRKPDTQEFNTLGWVLTLVMLGAAGFSWWWLDSHIAALGYQ